MYIKVKAIANSRKEKFEKIDDDTYVVSVKEKAERNMANNKIIELVALNLKVLREDIKIVTGHHSASKILFVENF